MWVSRDEWNNMKERIAALERRPTSPAITVYDYEQSGYGYPIDNQQITHERVLKSIMSKLGMELKYVRGQPARIDVTDAAGQSKVGGRADG